MKSMQAQCQMQFDERKSRFILQDNEVAIQNSIQIHYQLSLQRIFCGLQFTFYGRKLANCVT